MKQDFQRAMLLRIPRMEADPCRHWRDVLFLCDEYHAFATVGEHDPSGDEKFFALSRQAKCIPIVATQSISSLRSALPGDSWRTLLQTFRTKIFLSLSDDFSAKTASELCGREDQLKVSLHEIGPRMLATLKIPLLQGREFVDDDRAGTPRVVIVNQTLAKLMWPDGQPIERPLILNDQPYRVVGEVKDAQVRSASDPPQPFLYLPYWQNNLTPQVDATVMARVTGDPETMLPILKREIAAVDREVPISESITMRQQVDGEYKRVLLTSSVLTSAGVIALFLSMIGLYGALAFAVSQRTREIGIRMALGARAADVLRLIVGQGLRLVFVGLVVGLLAAAAATRLMASLLYGVSARDPFTFLFVAAALVFVGALACWIPARRATKVDPLVALRYE